MELYGPVVIILNLLAHLRAGGKKYMALISMVPLMEQQHPLSSLLRVK
jgi:hypothetical protein